MVRKNTSGFTLIETTLAITISSTLALIALAGFSGLRAQAEFTNGIDGLKEQLSSVRTEAFTTLNVGGVGNSNNVVLGKVVTFQPNSSSVDVSTILAPVGDSPSTVTVVPDRTITLPWGIKFVGAPAASAFHVTFIRSAATNTPIVSVNTGTLAASTPYSAVATTQNTTSSLHLNDPGGRDAWIDIDPTSNSIVRRFQ